jgi:hypothetical protein
MTKRYLNCPSYAAEKGVNAFFAFSLMSKILLRGARKELPNSNVGGLSARTTPEWTGVQWSRSYSWAQMVRVGT